MKRTVVSAEYLAGFFDGEGSVMLCQTGRMMPDGFRNSWTLKCAIPQVDVNVLAAIKADWGGTIALSSKAKHSTNQRQVYRLQWFGDDAVEMLKSIYPHLILKKDRAELAFQFDKLKKAGGIGSGRKRTQSERGQLHSMRMEMKGLNKRGLQ